MSRVHSQIIDMAEIRQIRKAGEPARNNRLIQYKNDVTSQYGDDGIIERIFSLLPESSKWCVEFGAVDGRIFSNTYNLIENRGWSGVLIEADEKRYEELLETHSGKAEVVCLRRFVEFEGAGSLDNILAETPIPKDFDLLSIDVDGCDYHIWKSVMQFSPKLVVVEFNPTIPNDVVFIQDRNVELNHGNSLHAFVELGKQKGYELIATTGANGYFVRAEYFDLFEIEDNSIDMMRDDQVLQTKMFQLFDGTLIICGLTKLLWHDVDIGLDELQVLPRSVRRFSGKTERK